MNVALWIIAGLLAAAFLAGGVAKLALPKEKLAAAGMGTVNDFSAGTVKAVGVLETLAAVGLVVPAAVGIAPILVPLAAVGLVALTTCVAVVEVRRRNTQAVVSSLTMLALAVVVAWGRFGPESFTS